MLVSTMRKERRGFDKDKYVAMMRRIDAEDGRFVAAVVNCDDASGGMIGSEPVDMAFNRFLRRCGNCSVSATAVGASSTSASRLCACELD